MSCFTLTIFDCIRNVVETVSADKEDQSKEAIIKLLNEYLIDSDITTVKAASTTLLAILRTEQGLAAVKRLPEVMRDNLAPFTPKKLRPSKSTGVARAVDVLDDELLWTNIEPYQQWVARLSAALASR